ncbi:MAG: TonB-dependent receptor [Acidobacteriota bacterium]
MSYFRLSFSALLTIILLNIFATLTLAIPQNQSKGEISGLVKDEADQPVRSAALTLSARDGRQQSTTTGEDGRFHFVNLAADEYFIKAEADGFRATVSQQIKLATGAAEQIELTLRVNGINEEVIITATSTAQTIDELSKSLTVVSREEIDARQEYSLGEVLRNEPGVRLKTFGGPGGFTSIRLRGLFDEDTAVLIDGLRLRDAGEFRGSSLSLNDSLFVNNVQRIEIMRGSGSALYGTTAVGGVINVVPYTGTGAPSGEVLFEGGSLGFFREAARVGGSIKNVFSYGIAASRIDTNDGIDDQDIYRATSLGTSVRYTPITGFSLSGVINYSRSFLQLNDSPFPIGPTGNEFGYATGAGPIAGFIPDLNDPDFFRTVRLFQSGVALRHRVNELISYYASFNYVRSNRRFFDGPDADPLLKSLITKAQGFFPAFTSDTLFRGRTYTFNSGVNLRVGAHNLVTVGFEAEKERLRQRTDFFGRESFSQKSYGFYFQDQQRYFENRLQLSVSGRVQTFTLDIPDRFTNIPPEDLARLKAIDVPNAYVGDGSIAYAFFNTGTKLRAHIGNSFRAPSLSERFSAFDGMFRPVRIGNPFLRPERVLSVDGGIDQSAFNDRLRLSLSYFYTRRQEIVIGGFVPFSAAAGAAFSQTNSPGGLSRGFEAAVAANPVRGLDVNLSYLYANAELFFNGQRSDGRRIFGSTRTFSIPRHTFNFSINERYRGLNVNFDLSAISDYDNPVFTPPELFTGFASPIFRFDGYVKADLGASYTFPLNDSESLEVFGKVSNLFDEKYFEDGFQSPGAIGTIGIKFRF